MRDECERCGVITECHKHHPYRRMNNSEEVVPLCPSCHRWVHENPLRARVIGLYKEMDGEYRGHLSLDPKEDDGKT